ncbi:MAG TPA: M18 family aminopeptidase [Spirochaetaceae bacterium]|nr:M18 family aminopeptidase [Spirochaetaceae bacterium]
MPAHHAQALCDFIDASPSAFHAVRSGVAMLEAIGAQRLDERERWTLKAGGCYYLIRDDASLVALRVGGRSPADAGFALAAAHADAPALRVRYEKAVVARGLERAAVEAYGGPIHATWLDRPLNMAGRALVKGKDAKPELRLVNLKRPVAVIPNLAIHFNREMNKGIEYPMNSALLPLVACAPDATGASVVGAPSYAWALRVCAKELGVEPQDILSAELSFVDAAPSLVWGEDGEFISAPRIDNLEGCHSVLSAFCVAGAREHSQLAVLFDNEEIGSGTPRGADSAFLRDVLARIIAARGGQGAEDEQRALARSFCISVDGAQGWHPSYADRFDEDYAPVLNKGPAVKANANQRYATDAVSEAAFKSWCAMAGVPSQRFRMRADLAPGSTIGPVNAALLGVRTVDVGVPMLAMHSVRECSGSYDHDYMIRALKAFYDSYAS